MCNLLSRGGGAIRKIRQVRSLGSWIVLEHDKVRENHDGDEPTLPPRNVIGMGE